MKYEFKDLIVLDLANNHQGDLEHGLQIINKLSSLQSKFDLNLCIKFQFRQLETFIHSEARSKKDLPYTTIYRNRVKPITIFNFA